MVKKCGPIKRKILPVGSCCMVLMGGVQMVGALTITNAFFMVLLLLAGFTSFGCGMAVGVCGKAGYIKGPTPTLKWRRLQYARFALGLTTIFFVVTVTLFHLHRSQIVGPWNNLISTTKPLKYKSLGQAFNDTGTWIVTVTSAVGAVASLCAFISTFSFLTSTFSPHENLATVQSAGWVYEPSPRPDIIENCPSTKNLQTRENVSRQKLRKDHFTTTSVTLLSFKHEATLARQVSLPTQSSQEKLVLVDSVPLMAPPSPLNLSFTYTGAKGVKVMFDLDGGTESKPRPHSQNIALDKISRF